jgi:plastocyanin
VTDDIQELLADEPFRQFTIVTVNKDEYVVYSPKQVTIPTHGETVHYQSRDYTAHVIAVRHVVELTFRTGAA